MNKNERGSKFPSLDPTEELVTLLQKNVSRIACGGVEKLPSIFHVPDASERCTVAPGWNEPRQGSSPAMWRSSSTMALGCTSAASKVFRIPNPPKHWFVWKKHARIESAAHKKNVFSPTYLSCASDNQMWLKQSAQLSTQRLTVHESQHLHGWSQTERTGRNMASRWDDLTVLYGFVVFTSMMNSNELYI